MKSCTGNLYVYCKSIKNFSFIFVLFLWFLHVTTGSESTPTGNTATAAAAAANSDTCTIPLRYDMPRPAGQRQLLGGQRTKATPTNATLRGIMELFAGGTANNFIYHAKRYVEKWGSLQDALQKPYSFYLLVQRPSSTWRERTPGRLQWRRGRTFLFSAQQCVQIYVPTSTKPGQWADVGGVRGCVKKKRCRNSIQKSDFYLRSSLV